MRNIAAITEELVFKWVDFKLPAYFAIMQCGKSPTTQLAEQP